jgi:hypothetical protein
MLLSGNVHAPGSLLIGLLTFLECLAVVYAVTNAVRSGAFSRQYSKR